jgi:YggT family protein
MNPFHWLVLTILDIYFWIIIATVIISWLIAFNIINGYNDFVRTIRVALARLTEPVLGPVRRLLPDLGGIDISPIIVLIGLQFVRYLYVYYVVYRGAA